MPVPTKDAPQGEAATSCPGCSQKKVIARLAHHWGLLDRPSDSHPGMDRLSEHLTKIYGQGYVESGKLKYRLDFVREAWMIWRDHISEEGRSLTIEEAYNLAAARSNWQKRPTGNAPIDRSQPSGDR